MRATVHALSMDGTDIGSVVALLGTTGMCVRALANSCNYLHLPHHYFQ